MNRKAYDKYFSQNFHDLNVVVTKSVAGNTFRAFHSKQHELGDKPSGFYRRWTYGLLSSSYPDLLACTAPIDYQKLLISSADKLVKDWDKATGGKHKIQFGVAAKLLNLSFKQSLLYEPKVRIGDRDRLSQFLDIPLDSFTLQGVMRLHPNLGIGKFSTMSFVKSKEHYIELQKVIRELCEKKVGLPPIYYEIRAWNMAH